MTNCITFEYEHQSKNFSIEDVDVDDNLKNETTLSITQKEYDGFRAEEKNEHYKYLGIRYIRDNENNNIEKLSASYVVGYKWLSEDKALCVKSKIDKSSQKRADITKMFSQCFSSPSVANKMTGVYGVDWEAPKIEIDEKDDELTPMMIVHFLNIVKTLSKKGLKKGYVKVTQNLTAKVKGKILVNQTIKHNHFANRLDKTVCSHQIFTTNCLENQIIKTALSHVSRYIYRNLRESKEVVNLLHFNQMNFELIDTKEVNFSDFKKIKHSPFFKEYKEALKLAEMIFKRIGFSLHQADYENTNITHIPPYHIDMTKLFENYVEMNLEKIYGCIDSQVSVNKGGFAQRPDFL